MFKTKFENNRKELGKIYTDRLAEIKTNIEQLDTQTKNNCVTMASKFQNGEIDYQKFKQFNKCLENIQKIKHDIEKYDQQLEKINSLENMGAELIENETESFSTVNLGIYTTLVTMMGNFLLFSERYEKVKDVVKDFLKN